MESTSSIGSAKIFQTQLGSNALTVYWSWASDGPDYLDYVEVKWFYYLEDGIVRNGDTNQVDADAYVTENEYEPPDGTVSVMAYLECVCSLDEDDSNYWDETYFSTGLYYMLNNAPITPDAPEIEISTGYSQEFETDFSYYVNLRVAITVEDSNTYEIDDLNYSGTYMWSNANRVEFYIYSAAGTLLLPNDDISTKVTLKQGYAELEIENFSDVKNFTYGNRYCAKCRLINTQTSSEIYSEYSTASSWIYAPPDVPTDYGTQYIPEYYGDDTILVYWDEDENAVSHDIQYMQAVSNVVGANAWRILSNSGTETVSDIEELGNGYYLSGLALGYKYYFRIRANGKSDVPSGWTSLFSCITGAAPEAPTAWSNLSQIEVGETFTIYWSHNGNDESSQTYGQVYIRVYALMSEYRSTVASRLASADSADTLISAYSGTDISEETPGNYSSSQYFERLYTIENSIDDDEKDKVSYISFDTSCLDGVSGDVVVVWQVRTAGIFEEDDEPAYGDYTNEQEAYIYIQPTVEMYNKRSSSSSSYTSLTTTISSLPFEFTFVVTPDYYGVSNLDEYSFTQEITDYHVTITADSSYSVSDLTGETIYVSAGDTIYSKSFTPDDDDFEPYVSISAYDVRFKYGQTYTMTLTVGLTSGLYAETSETITFSASQTSATPSVSTSLDSSVPIVYVTPSYSSAVTFIVYRVEADKNFTIVESEVTTGTTVTDPHASLDFATYRVVAVHTTSGGIGYTEVTVEIRCTDLVLQWDESWSSSTSWSGELLHLPYNLDISESSDRSISTVEYAGRSHSVNYYGTKIDHTMSVSTEVPKHDSSTLQKLRQLNRCLEDVFVREPSGVGYWAQVNASFSKNHTEVTMPIELEITRVDGDG